MVMAPERRSKGWNHKKWFYDIIVLITKIGFNKDGISHLVIEFGLLHVK